MFRCKGNAARVSLCGQCGVHDMWHNPQLMAGPGKPYLVEVIGCQVQGAICFTQLGQVDIPKPVEGLRALAGTDHHVPAEQVPCLLRAGQLMRSSSSLLGEGENSLAGARRHQQTGAHSAERAATQLQIMVAGKVKVTPLAQHRLPQHDRQQTGRVDAEECACMSQQPLARKGCST